MEVGKLNKELDLVKQKIDDIQIETLELTQHYLNCQLQTEEKLKDWFLLLATERKNTGSKLISTVSIPTEDIDHEYKAFTTVITQRLLGSCYHRSLNSNNSSSTEIKEGSVKDEQGKNNNSQQKFGILKSSAMKSAEIVFKLCIESIIDGVNFANQIQLNCNLYAELIQEKNKLTIDLKIAKEESKTQLKENEP